MARAPYGYRYVKRSEHADACFEVDEAEAPVVRELFRRYLDEDESIAKIGRWLTAQGVPTRTRATGWNNATIRGMLRNPAYAGQAAYGKTRATGEVVHATRQARLRGQRSTHISREEVAPEDWKRITVPALISEEQFALAQERLHRNSRFSPRNTCRPSLLQGILVCRECGYAYYRCSTRSQNGKLREYYRCSGTDGHRRPEGRVCENRPVRLTEVDELVWSRVLGLLEDPTLIQTEIDRRLQTMRATHPATGRRAALERDLTRAQTALRPRNRSWSRSPNTANESTKRHTSSALGAEPQGREHGRPFRPHSRRGQPSLRRGRCMSARPPSRRRHPLARQRGHRGRR
jgi:site-specific DNA recombinase